MPPPALTGRIRKPRDTNRLHWTRAIGRIVFVSEKLLDLAAVADQLNVSQRTVRRMVKRGRLQCVRVSINKDRLLRFTQAQVAAFIEAQSK